MQTSTGTTIYEEILSLNSDNLPITATTFDAIALKNGQIYTGVTVNLSISDVSRGLFIASWSADTIGDYQIYIKNNNTNVVFLSDIVNVKIDSDLTSNIYVGL